jgi:hypothetical protein
LVGWFGNFLPQDYDLNHHRLFVQTPIYTNMVIEEEEIMMLMFLMTRVRRAQDMLRRWSSEEDRSQM